MAPSHDQIGRNNLSKRGVIYKYSACTDESVSDNKQADRRYQMDAMMIIVQALLAPKPQDMFSGPQGSELTKILLSSDAETSHAMAEAVAQVVNRWEEGKPQPNFTQVLNDLRKQARMRKLKWTESFMFRGVRNPSERYQKAVKRLIGDELKGDKPLPKTAFHSYVEYYTPGEQTLLPFTHDGIDDFLIKEEVIEYNKDRDQEALSNRAVLIDAWRNADRAQEAFELAARKMVARAARKAAESVEEYPLQDDEIEAVSHKTQFVAEIEMLCKEHHKRQRARLQDKAERLWIKVNVTLTQIEQLLSVKAYPKRNLEFSRNLYKSRKAQADVLFQKMVQGIKTELTKVSSKGNNVSIANSQRAAYRNELVDMAIYLGIYSTPKYWNDFHGKVARFTVAIANESRDQASWDYDAMLMVYNGEVASPSPEQVLLVSE